MYLNWILKQGDLFALRSKNIYKSDVEILRNNLFILSVPLVFHNMMKIVFRRDVEEMLFEAFKAMFCRQHLSLETFFFMTHQLLSTYLPSIINAINSITKLKMLIHIFRRRSTNNVPRKQLHIFMNKLNNFSCHPPKLILIIFNFFLAFKRFCCFHRL